MPSKFSLISTVLVLILYIGNAFAQPDMRWSQTYGGEDDEECRSIIQTADRGFALACATGSFDIGDSFDFWLVKTNEDGEELWSQTFTRGQSSYCNSIIQTSNGDFALAGYTLTGGEFMSDFWLVVADNEGEVLWSQTYDNESVDACLSFIQTNDRGFALAGITKSFDNDDSYDFCLVRTDEDGEELWSQSYGGGGNDYCYSVIQTEDGGFALAGYTQSFGAGRIDFWLIKTNEDGDSLWSQTYGGENDDACYSVIQTPDGGFVLSGGTTSFGGGSLDMCLVRTDNEGGELWSQTYGTENNEHSFSVVQTNDGGFALAGYTATPDLEDKDFFIVMTEPDPVSVPPILDPALPSAFSVANTYPNPFNSKTTISYNLPITSRITIAVFDLSGRKMLTLVDDLHLAGSYNVVCDAEALATGMYFIHAQASGWMQTQKIMLIK